jgi:prolyl oligopeptidase PreP (S9A serine peptidase family)
MFDVVADLIMPASASVTVPATTEEGYETDQPLDVYPPQKPSLVSQSDNQRENTLQHTSFTVSPVT